MMNRILLITALMLAVLSACSKNTEGDVVPLGEVKALERLAQAYKKLAESHRLPPSDLTPAQKKKFVVQVFNEAGYNYFATLQNVATDKTFDPRQQYHKDLVELLLFAHYHRQKVPLEDVYSSEELRYVRQIEKRL